YVQDAQVRFAPPPPVVRPDPGWLRKYPTLARTGWVEVDAAAFPVLAAVTPAPGVARVNVSVRQGDEVVKIDGLTVDRKLMLKPGVNVVEVRAVNDGAPDDLLDEE